MMTLEQMNAVAMVWMIPNGFEHLVVDVEKADKLFQNYERYLKPHVVDAERPNASPRFLDFMEKTDAKLIHAPIIHVTPSKIIFYDGRHRFAVMRDAGVKKMKIAAFHPSYRIAKSLGILIEEGEAQNVSK